MAGTAGPGVFPSPDAVIAVASQLDDQNGLTLQSGLGTGGSASLYALAEVHEFVERLADLASATVDARKTLTFLDGGNGNGGVLATFRLKRARYLREKRPDRSASSISGSSFVDGRYFARQLFLPLIDACIEQVAMVENGTLAILPADAAEKVRYCRNVRANGGIALIKREVEQEAERTGEEKRLDVTRGIRASCIEKNEGRPLSSLQRKTVRDSGSSSKSNEKRKHLYVLTRQKLEHFLCIRADVLDAWTSALVPVPKVDPGPAYLPHPAA